MRAHASCANIGIRILKAGHTVRRVKNALYVVNRLMMCSPLLLYCRFDGVVPTDTEPCDSPYLRVRGEW